MKITHDNIQLCADCLQVAVNGDYSGLDYYYGELAEVKAATIDEGLAKLQENGHLSMFFQEDQTTLWCSACSEYMLENEALPVLNPGCEDCPDIRDQAGCCGCGEPASVPSCRHCGSTDLSDLGTGYEEFSREDCDCCGTQLAGARYRFAILGEDKPCP